MKYDFKALEARWQARWTEQDLARTPEAPKKKFYVLEMFAYPSGDIHMGHFRNYSIGDAASRYRMMKGFDVLHPFGWDAFGLPAEQAAIKNKLHPGTWTRKNIETGKKTLQRMAISYDWEREVRTCEPDYYKWTQWLFLLLFKNGWAYQAASRVNWCEEHGILANEQCQDGKCWRCKQEVVKKPIENCWFFKYSAMADRLLNDVDKLSGWPESTKTLQRNWIGKSVGCEIDFMVPDPDGQRADEAIALLKSKGYKPMDARESGTPPPSTGGGKLTVFTTRPDTTWGVSFVVIAPEHPLAATIATPEVKEYIRKAGQKSERERTMEGEKDGVFTGRHVTNPLNGEKVPLWVADYVLAHYGTGVVMGVPAHDTRDYAFAKKYKLPIKVVISGGPSTYEDAYAGEGSMIDSGELTGTPSPSGIPKVIDHVAKKGVGRAKTHFKLKDWLISRQRYWGCPIPIIHCPTCGAQAVPEKDLPVVLPEITEFIPKGRSPLADHPEFINAPCPKCGGPAQRNPDTMDTFMCSSWYLYRYVDAKNAAEPWRKEEARKWLPVDLYIGGAEHACMHLLYFRFIAKVLFDAGWIPSDEPVVRLYHQGMVGDEKGEIMSKSKGNAVSPTEIMDTWGVDVCRLAMFYFAPSDAEIKWKEDGLVGAHRLVTRLWDLYEELAPKVKGVAGPSSAYKPLRQAAHVMLARMTDACESGLDFNTAIATVYKLLNAFDAAKPEPKSDDERRATREVLGILSHVLAPLAPFLGEEFHEMLGGQGSVFRAAWPAFDAGAAQADTIEIPVQVNGKLKGKFTVAAGASDDELKAQALALPALAGITPKKVIVVKGKLVNVVA
ncbi:MAG TPA: leucine--tRNA ligase [Planctomycetota bacterium]|nr:leucine--tRNA ligase [Planctomycetota bacterium]